METKWSIRKYREGDEEANFELARAVNGDIISKEDWLKQWEWKYQQNPDGKAITWFAEVGDRLVGQYTINPVNIKCGGEIVRGAQSVDTMTHPDYRRQKIFETLAQKVYEDAEKDGISLVFGFPNNLSYPGFVEKLGWRDIAAHHAMVRPLNIRNTARYYSANVLFQRLGRAGLCFMNKVISRPLKPAEIIGLKLTQVSTFDERINDLWKKAEKNNVIMVQRDKAYLNWRYTKAPGFEYKIFIGEIGEEIQGYIVFRCEKHAGAKVGRIFDLVTPSNEPAITRHLVIKAIEVFRQENVDFALYRLIAGKTLHAVIRRCGFFSFPFVGDDVHFIALDLSHGKYEQLIRDRCNWFVQTGDSDAL